MQIAGQTDLLSFKSLSGINSRQDNFYANSRPVKHFGYNRKSDQSICFGLKSTVKLDPAVSHIRSAFEKQHPEQKIFTYYNGFTTRKDKKQINYLFSELYNQDASQNKELFVKTAVYIANRLSSPNGTPPDLKLAVLIEFIKKLPAEIKFFPFNFKEICNLDSFIFIKCVTRKEIVEQALKKPDSEEIAQDLIDYSNRHSGNYLGNILTELYNQNAGQNKELFVKIIISTIKKLYSQNDALQNKRIATVNNFIKNNFDLDDLEKLKKLDFSIFEKCVEKKEEILSKQITPFVREKGISKEEVVKKLLEKQNPEEIAQDLIVYKKSHRGSYLGNILNELYEKDTSENKELSIKIALGIIKNLLLKDTSIRDIKVTATIEFIKNHITEIKPDKLEELKELNSSVYEKCVGIKNNVKTSVKKSLNNEKVDTTSFARQEEIIKQILEKQNPEEIVQDIVNYNNTDKSNYVYSILTKLYEQDTRPNKALSIETAVCISKKLYEESTTTLRDMRILAISNFINDLPAEVKFNPDNLMKLRELDPSVFTRCVKVKEVVEQALKKQDPEKAAQIIINYNNWHKGCYLGNILPVLYKQDTRPNKELFIETIVCIIKNLLLNNASIYDVRVTTVTKFIKNNIAEVGFNPNNFNKLLELDSNVFKECIDIRTFLANKSKLKYQQFRDGLKKVVENQNKIPIIKRLIDDLRKLGLSSEAFYVHSFLPMSDKSLEELLNKQLNR